jgi:U3 small nucleolar RNA-associated protein 22
MNFQDNFLLRRKGQGENVGPVMFLATVYDKASEAWTELSPSGLVSYSLNWR